MRIAGGAIYTAQSSGARDAIKKQRRHKMGRMSKEELARFEGADWMLRLAEEKGLEAAREELEQRNLRGIPLKVKMSDVNNLYREERKNLIKSLTIIAVIAMHDEFGFGTERINRFIHEFENHADAINKKYVSWQEVQEIIRKETGILIPLGGKENGQGVPSAD